jgi:hypothetical protein
LYKCKPLVIVVVLVIVVLVDVLVLVAAVVLVDVLVIVAAVVLVIVPAIVLVDVLVIVAAVVLVDVLVIIAAVVLVVIAISREVWREVKWVPSGLNCCEKWPQSIRKKKVVFQFSLKVGPWVLPLHFQHIRSSEEHKKYILRLGLGCSSFVGCFV